MTPQDTPAGTATTRGLRPRWRWTFFAVALVFFLVGLSGLSFEGKLSDVQKNDNSAYLPASADSTKVSNAAQDFSSTQTIPGVVVFERTSGITAADRAFVLSVAAKARSVEHVAADQIFAPQESRNGKVLALSVPLVGKQGNVDVKGPQLVHAEKRVLRLARSGAPPGLVVHSAGAGGILVAFIDSFSGLDGTLLLAAGVVVIVILLFVYRSPVLWFFPLFSAGLALGAAALVVYPLAKHGVLTLSGESQGILSVLVIGAGTDYALLLISRYREELHAYDSRTAAMTAAWRGAAPAIGASAVTVILGLLCLTFADLRSTASLGPVCAIGIAATVLVMLTVLPVLLVLSGRWIFWPKRPRVDHETDLATHGAWSRFAGSITGHARLSWTVGTVVLVAGAVAIIGLRTGGLTNSEQFTGKPDAVVGQTIYDDAGFGQGAGAPANILTDVGSADRVIAAVRRVDGVSSAANAVCVETDFAKLTSVAAKDPRELASLRTSCAPTALQVTPHDGRTLIDATLTSSYDSSAAYSTIDRIRAAVDAVPGAHALVGGSSATNLDIQNASRHDRDLIIPIVLVVILIILGLLLRAILVPVLLIISVVLSFLCSLGVSSLFFNHVFRFANADPAFPLFVFIFLVALGIDYNIFLMTRVREETLRFGTRDGIRRGLAVTGGVITSAGVVLASTFVVLGVLPLVFLAELGFAVAFGVLLDTILVRSIIVPALAHDIGKRIWWPSRLARAGAPD